MDRRRHKTGAGRCEVRGRERKRERATIACVLLLQLLNFCLGVDVEHGNQSPVGHVSVIEDGIPTLTVAMSDHVVFLLRVKLEHTTKINQEMKGQGNKERPVMLEVR